MVTTVTKMVTIVTMVTTITFSKKSSTKSCFWNYVWNEHYQSFKTGSFIVFYRRHQNYLGLFVVLVFRFYPPSIATTSVHVTSV